MTHDELDRIEAQTMAGFSLAPLAHEIGMLVREAEQDMESSAKVVLRLVGLARECLAWRMWHDELLGLGVVDETEPDDDELAEARRLRAENEGGA